MSERSARQRGLSQHFLRSERVCAQLVDEAGIGPTDLVLEIGAGAGALTAHLARRAGQLVAVEADPVLAQRLRRTLGAASHVQIVCADALKVALPASAYRVVSNIPYHLTTEICHRLFDDPTTGPIRADLVVQWEVAVKRSSVARQNLLNLSWAPWYEILLTRRLSRQLFEPAPSTDSAVLSIRRRREPLVPAELRRDYLRLITAAYRADGGQCGQVLRRWFGHRELTILANDAGFDMVQPLTSLDVWQWMVLFERHQTYSNRTKPRR